jgi:hypothetical protein
MEILLVNEAIYITNSGIELLFFKMIFTGMLHKVHASMKYQKWGIQSYKLTFSLEVPSG